MVIFAGVGALFCLSHWRCTAGELKWKVSLKLAGGGREEMEIPLGPLAPTTWGEGRDKVMGFSLPHLTPFPSPLSQL